MSKQTNNEMKDSVPCRRIPVIKCRRKERIKKALFNEYYVNAAGKIHNRC
jgi:hypothetical protein